MAPAKCPAARGNLGVTDTRRAGGVWESRQRPSRNLAVPRWRVADLPPPTSRSAAPLGATSGGGVEAAGARLPLGKKPGQPSPDRSLGTLRRLGRSWSPRPLVSCPDSLQPGGHRGARKDTPGREHACPPHRSRSGGPGRTRKGSQQTGRDAPGLGAWPHELPARRPSALPGSGASSARGVGWGVCFVQGRW